MKSQMSLAALSLALVLASACAQDKTPSAGGTQPATEGEPQTKTPNDDADPNFDPSKSPTDLDKNGDPGNSPAAEISERKMTFAFDAEKLSGAAGEAVVLTIDHKKVSSSSKCAVILDHSPIAQSGYDPSATTLTVEVSSQSASADSSSDTVQPDYEVFETFTFTCGKSPMSVSMQNMDTGHKVKLSLTVHTPDATVYAEAKPFIALNKADGEKVLTLEYPNGN